MATIRDVARLAGVSPATVSRVINGNHPVKAATKAAVEKAIRELGFHPSIAGQSLSRKEKQTILLITSSTLTELYQRTLQGINEVLAKESYDLLITCLFEVPGDPTSSNWPKCAQYIEGGLAGGVILMATQVIETAARNAPLPIPAVQVSEHIVPGFANSVSCNNQSATYELTRRLIAQGYRRFGFVSVRKSYETEASDYSRDRKSGMLRALWEAGLPWDEALESQVVLNVGSSSALHYEAALEACRHHLALPKETRPDVILCADDIIAAAYLKSFQDAGLRVPEDVAITGFDNSFISQISYPQLTTIQTPSLEMGKEAARLLLSLMRGEREDGMSILLPHKILERGSTLRSTP